MRHILGSLSLALTVLVSGFVFLVPQSAHAEAYCVKTDVSLFCYAQKEQCNSATCQKVDDQRAFAEKEGMKFCKFIDNGFACYQSADLCNDSKCINIFEADAHAKEYGKPTGEVWCNNAMASGRCFDTIKECENSGVAATCVKQTEAYCFKEDSAINCFKDLDSCKSYGWTHTTGFNSNDCTFVDVSKSKNLREGVEKATGIIVNSTIILNGRYDYEPLESMFISKENAKLPNFLKFIFNVGIAIVGLAALFMMTIGGITYIFSAGNQATAGSAKKMITDATLGLLLAFFSWVILFTINPDLVGIAENLEKLTAVSDDISRERAAGGTGNANAGGTGNANTGGDTVVPSTQLENGTKLAEHGLPVKRGACKGDVNDCAVNSVLAARLEGLEMKLDEESIDWHITEAWPPTVKHYDKCHQNGTCIDANFTGGTQPTPENIKKFIEAAEKAGLRPVYEVKTKKEAEALIKAGVPRKNVIGTDKRGNDLGNHISAPHFSIYMN